MEGLTCVDMQASQALYHGKVPKARKLTAPRKKFLARILTGAFSPLSRLFKAGCSPTPICPWCDAGEEETKEHLFWRSPAWDHVRAPFLAALRAIDFRN